MCQQMSACLADLVTIIHSIFKSLNWSLITKEELVHKIIMNNFDIVERSAYQCANYWYMFDCISKVGVS